MDKAVLAIAFQKEKKEARDMLGSAAQRLAKAEDGNKSTSLKRIQEECAELKVFEVQYNPKTLKLSTQGGRTQCENQQVPGQAEPNQQYAYPEETSLSFDLIVDGEKTGETINALMGMMSSESTRQVLFAWGNMSFPGEVAQMSTSYTMFSPDGSPIRGQVSMTIQSDSTTKGQLTYWEKAFEKL